MNLSGEARGEVREAVEDTRRNWMRILLAPFYAIREACRVEGRALAKAPPRAPRSRRVSSGRAPFFAVLALAGVAGGCAGTPFDRGRQALTGFEQAVRAAAVALGEVDAREQAAVPGRARARCAGDADPSCVERAGREILREYLKHYDAARRVIGDVHAALAGAAAVLLAAELAQRAEGVAEVVAGLAPLARDLAEALAGVGIAPPPVPSPGPGPGGP